MSTGLDSSLLTISTGVMGADESIGACLGLSLDCASFTSLAYRRQSKRGQNIRKRGEDGGASQCFGPRQAWHEAPGHFSDGPAPLIVDTCGRHNLEKLQAAPWATSSIDVETIRRYASPGVV